MAVLCVCIMCMPSTHGGQKGVSDPLGLEFQWALRIYSGSTDEKHWLFISEPSLQPPL